MDIIENFNPVDQSLYSDMVPHWSNKNNRLENWTYTNFSDSISEIKSSLEEIGIPKEKDIDLSSCFEIGSEHLLYGLTAVKNCLACKILSDFGGFRCRYRTYVFILYAAFLGS